LPVIVSYLPFITIILLSKKGISYYDER
jgi:hypothetical protein